MKKILNIFAVLILSSLSYAGVAKFTFKHVVKPVSHSTVVVAKDSGKVVVKSVKVVKKAVY